jgi:FKBP-type peptidyl-prolyl cis-trans isomerase
VKYAFTAALVAVTALGCASAQDSKTAPAAKAAAPAKANCTPPPKELVTRDLAPGSGDKTVMARSGVSVGYTGWLYDPCAKDFKGEKFDSSEGRATPFGFMVGAGRVIKGWDEGLIGMKEGGKRVLIIPADKAYGAAGAAGGKIPPGATLVFEVEVFAIPFPAPAPAGAPKK